MNNNIMFSIFKRRKKTIQSGAIIDTRPEEEKKKDYKLEELVSAITPVNWIEKNTNGIRRFPIFNQDGSGSCVAQTMAKMVGIMYWLKNNDYVHFSATDVYQKRSNRPYSGMGGIDVFKIAQEGITLEQLVPSQNMTDTQMDSVKIESYKKEVGEIFKIGNYVTLPIQDIDTVASVIQVTGKPVMVWFFFNSSEWDSAVPSIKDSTLQLSGSTTSRHSVTAVDCMLYNGKKALVIEDSWGPNYGNGGQRIITEDFFKSRNFFAAYTMNFKFDESLNETKPCFTFNTDLEFGQENEEIAILQDILKYEGLFPVNTESTGYFGAITKKAVQDFQLKYDITDLVSGGFGRVGPLTRKALNAVYS